jgi:hypothetical protein
MRYLTALTILALALLTPLLVPAQEQSKLAVMTLEDSTGDLSRQLIDNLTDYLRTQVARRGTFIVIDKGRQAEAIKKIAGDARKESYKECYDEKCQIPLGQALSADTILRVKLTRIGSTYQLNAEVVDLAKEAVDPGMAGLVEIPANPSSGRDDRLLQGMRHIARQIAGDLPGGAGETITIGGGGDYGVVTSGGIASTGDGIVKFESTPTGATVKIDGRQLPRVTPVEEFLSLGQHKVQIYGHEGYETFKEDLVLQSGQTIKVNLKPVVGSVVVRPRDPDGNLVTGVAVFIDGEEIARAPVRIQGVLAGRRVFRMEKEGMRPVERQVNVSKNGNVDVDINMSPSQGVLRVKNLTVRDSSATQTGLSGQVVVNGKGAGNTPIDIPLFPGTHKVEVKHEMAVTGSFSVTIEDGKTAELSPALRAADNSTWRAYVAKQRMSERSGFLMWLSFVSSSPGMYQKINFKEKDRTSTTAGSFARYMQALTYGLGLEGDYVSFKAFDSIADISGLKLSKDHDHEVGISPFMNPTATLSLRPTPMFPVKVEGNASFYWAWAREKADVQFNYKQWMAGGHLVYELKQDYLAGFANLEVAAGVQWYGASGDITPAGFDSSKYEFEAEGMLYGGRFSWVIHTGKKAGIFLGAGYYIGSDEQSMILWQLDWRGRM